MILSVAISATNPINLQRCLESFSDINSTNYEIIINNATESDSISEIISRLGYIEIRKRTNIVEARYLTGSKANGNFTLLLDDTRYMDKPSFHNLIKNLKNYEKAITVINEYQSGEGCYDRLVRRQN